MGFANFKTDINEFRGEENLQIMLLDYKKISP